MPSSAAEKARRQEEEKGIRIDDNTVVKVTKPSPGNRARPSYRCERCDASFPSPLDEKGSINGTVNLSFAQYTI